MWGPYAPLLGQLIHYLSIINKKDGWLMMMMIYDIYKYIKNVKYIVYNVFIKNNYVLGIVIFRYYFNKL